MRSLLERSGSRGGLISTDAVPSEIRAEHSETDALFMVARLKGVLTLFSWFITLTLVVLGSVPNSSATAAGELMALGYFVLSGGTLLLIRSTGDTARTVTVPFICYLFLLLGPQILPSFSGNRNVLFELGTVLLIGIPALFRLWSWRVQSTLGLIALSSLLLRVAVGRDPVSSQTFAIIIAASVLSTLVLRLQNHSTDAQTSRWQILSSRLLHEASLRHLPQQVWSVMLLQSGLLVVLIFLDTFLGSNELSPPVLVKLYGLLIVVFGSSLAVLFRAEQIARVILVTSILVGGVISLSRVAYPETSNLYFALPYIHLFLIAAPLHWAVEVHLQFVWSVIVCDLLVRVAALAALTGSHDWFSLLGQTLSESRAEIAVISLGGAFSVIVASSIRRYRFRHLSQFVDLYQLGGDSELNSARGEQETNREIPLNQPCSKDILPERNKALLFGLFCLGILSSSLSSQLLLARLPSSGGPLVGTWVVFLVLWGVLFQQERKHPEWPHLWGFGAALNVLLLLWPTTLILVADHTSHEWLFWPVALGIGIGFIPWNLKQLLPVLLIDVVLGAELSYRLRLGVSENIVLIGVGMFSVLVSLQNARRTRERFLLSHYHEALQSCETEPDVLRVLADYLRELFEGELAFVSASPEQLELVRETETFLLKKSDWPLVELRDGLHGVSFDRLGIGLKPVHWLPSRLSFFDRRLGVVAPGCGLVVELGAVEDGQFLSPSASTASTGGRRILLFVVTTLPVYELVREQELTIARMFASVARLQIASFLEQAEQRRVAEAVEAQVQEREYELSALVHDINNTVQDLTLLCEMIVEEQGEENEPENARADASTISRVKRISAIARSVATVVSDAKRRRELEKLQDLTPRELVEVTEVVRELVSFARIRAERKRISIEEPILPLEEVYVLISVREHLETILRNILNNAILYSQPGASVLVRLSASGTEVAIEVSDTGVGLSEEECKAVFFPGFRGKGATAAHGGLGLGLAESLRVAKAAGGDVVARSAGIGAGSTFTVTLPRHASPVAGLGVQSWALLVDDQPALTDFYARIARAMQLQPEIAASVDEAWAIIQSRGRPGLVMTDIHLGTSDGLDLVERLRTEFGTQLPIVVISGMTSEEVMKRVRAVGATDFVPKPVGRRALFARIQSLISGESPFR